MGHKQSRGDAVVGLSEVLGVPISSALLHD